MNKDAGVKPFNKYYIGLAVLGIIILLLDLIGPFNDRMEHIAFFFFSLLCLVMLIDMRKSIGKIIGIVLFFIFGLYFYLN